MNNTRDNLNDKWNGIMNQARLQVGKLTGDRPEVAAVKIITVVWLLILLVIGLRS
jgi:hypothetical protein